MTENEERGALQGRIVGRLSSCDEDTLERIDELLRHALNETEGSTENNNDDEEDGVLFPDGITRRQFIAGTAAAGATLVTTNAATALVAGSLGARAGGAKAELESQVELMRLQGLLTLYENLEQVGIDALLSTGIAVLSISIDGLQLGITALENGVSLVDTGVSAIENAFPTIRSGLSLVERLVTSVENRLTQLQELMSDVQEVVSPFSDAVGSFFSSLVERIPGIGPTIVDTLDRMSELLGSLPDVIGKVRSDLLEPLREDWFTDDEESGLKGTLLNPLQDRLLEPLEEFLSDLNDAIDEWQDQLVDPVEEALIQRDVIRQQISEYKEREGIL
jgi:hypothetical protein